MLNFLRTRLLRPEPESLDSDTLLPTSVSSIPERGKHPFMNRHGRDIQVAVRTLALCTVIYCGAALWIGFSVRKTSFVADVDSFCMHHVSSYSPVANEVKPNWHTRQFNGSFLHENIYRQSASPEVDSAWEALGVNYRSIVVRPEEAEETGLRHDQVKISQAYGGGYLANVEGLHHLHCLNLLRKALHWNYDYYLAKKEGPFVNSEHVVRIHTTHCLDILRQLLMCTPDVGMLGQVWWQPASQADPMPFVDFNTKHRCRDYEAVRKWADAHQLPPEKTVDMTRFYELPKPGDRVYAELP